MLIEKNCKNTPLFSNCNVIIFLYVHKIRHLKEGGKLYTHNFFHIMFGFYTT